MEYKGKNYSAKELIIVMEDFDATKSKVLKTRAKNSAESIPGQELNNDFSELIALNNSVEKLSSVVKAADKKDDLNLSCVLNVLDGIKELHGIMIIITTNHIEDIDEAFLRTGRFDFKLELKKASQKSIVEMMSNRYKISVEDIYKNYPNVKNIKDGILSPADIALMCYKEEDIESCINRILLESQK
jgi:SpoVK/Ycf46/Vps4 family AAA+-type ATPase